MDTQHYKNRAKVTPIKFLIETTSLVDFSN